MAAVCQRKDRLSANGDEAIGVDSIDVSCQRSDRWINCRYEVRRSIRIPRSNRLRRMDAKGLKEGIGCMPMDGSCRYGGSLLQFEVLMMDGTCQCVDVMIDTEDEANVGSFRSKLKKQEPVDWIDVAGLSLELADEQQESVAGTTGTKERRPSIGSMKMA